MRYKWTIVITSIIFVGGVFFVFSYDGKDANNKTKNLFEIDFIEQESIQDDVLIKVDKEEAISKNTANSFEEKSPNYLLYSNDKYKFSFEYPENVTTSFFNEGVGIWF